MSQTVVAPPRPWSCPSCGRRVPARVAVCHCGTTRESAPGAADAPSPDPAGADRRPAPGAPRALLAAAALVVAVGAGWALFAPDTPEATTPVLGRIDPGPPDPALLRARKAPPPPPFKLPWWK